jgi:hypothetical protein
VPGSTLGYVAVLAPPWAARLAGSLNGPGGPGAVGGAQVAWAALAGLCRQLAAELGPNGVRVAWLFSPGSPGPSSGLDEDGQLQAGFQQPDGQ